jgi:hypothetical protein
MGLCKAFDRSASLYPLIEGLNFLNKVADVGRPDMLGTDCDVGRYATACQFTPSPFTITRWYGAHPCHVCTGTGLSPSPSAVTRLTHAVRT